MFSALSYNPLCIGILLEISWINLDAKRLIRQAVQKVVQLTLWIPRTKPWDVETCSVLVKRRLSDKTGLILKP